MFRPVLSHLQVLDEYTEKIYTSNYVDAKTKIHEL